MLFASVGASLLLLWLQYVPTALAATASLPNSLTLSYEVVGSAQSAVQPLAIVSYDPSTLKYVIDSWTPPSLDTLKSVSSDPTSQRLLRILLDSGSSTVTTLGAFDAALSQNITLWLSPNGDGSITSASVSSYRPAPLTKEEIEFAQKVERAKARGKPIPTPTGLGKNRKKAQQETADKSPTVKVNLLAPVPGPKPKLGSRKPPVVGADGKEVPAEVQEDNRSFFQKYWWVFLAGAILVMSSGGAEK